MPLSSTVSRGAASGCQSLAGSRSVDTDNAPAYPSRPSFFGRAQALATTTVTGDETHIPAQQNQACPQSRLPCPHGDQGRPEDPEASARQGSRATVAVAPPDPFAATVTKDKKAASATRPGRASSRLKRTSRLSDSASFGRVFGKGRKSRDNFFTVLSRDNGREYARLGLAISKKHCRLATGRNRLKRVVRESFRRHQGELAGLDIVVLGQSGTSRASNDELFASLVGHWQRIGAGRSRDGS